MIVTGLDGKEYKFNYSKFKSRRDRGGKSSLHTEARQLLKETFPSHSLYEEVTLPGSKKHGKSLLYADFFIPDLNLIVEVHGQQHYEYCHFFHKTKADFFASKQKDNNKKEWALINNMRLVVFPYNERDKWKSMI